MPETWYEVEWGVIMPLQVVRETDRCVFVEDRWSKKPRRQAKTRGLFRTLPEANTYNLERLQANVDGLRERLARAERDLAQFTESIAKPTE